LLVDLTKFREKLTQNIHKQTKTNLSEDELDEAVQRIIDRLIFIRTLEDRTMEPPMLKPILRENYQKKVYTKLIELFRQIDGIYNSKLFEEHLCEQLNIDDDVLEMVINGLYKPQNSIIEYDFSLIDADVLGNIYEQYLGHILKKTEKRAKLTDGKTHRKEQGIYYTPTYIVDYIVKNTIEELAKDKKIDLDKVKILDPACGSGSFLIKAYDYLMKEQQKRDKNFNQTKFDITDSESINLRYTKKVEILKNSIFGVDLDEKAVEIAQLNLLLKAAEKKQRLPVLKNNIKIGNSLIDDPAVAGDKAFKWEEQFPDIIQFDKDGKLKEGYGFDVIIGNPPYVDIKQLDSKIVKYLFGHYETVENRMNLYSTFIENCYKLLKNKGYFSFIIPNSLLYNESYRKLRKLLLSNVSLKVIVRLPDNVFEGVKVETIILVFQKNFVKNNTCKLYIYNKNNNISIINQTNCQQVILNQDSWLKDKKNIINLNINNAIDNILNKIDKDSTNLVDICDFSLGITPYDKYKGHTIKQIEEKVFHSDIKKDNTFKPLLSGANIVRYGVFWDKKEYISYGVWLGAPREQRFFVIPRIVVRQIISGRPGRIFAGYTEEELYNTQIAFNLVCKSGMKINIKYILLLLNSKLINFYHKNKFLDPTKTLFQKILIANAKKLPIKIISLLNQKQVVDLVDKMLSLNKQLQEFGDKKTDRRQQIEEEIKKTDEKIDELVYKIYDITAEERKIIEDSLK